MHTPTALIAFLAILITHAIAVPQATSQSQSQLTSPPAAAAPTPSGNSSSVAIYPLCARICANETLPGTGCGVFNIDCACGVEYRSKLAACEEAACDDADRKAAAAIEQQLCAPTYSANGTLASQVGTAVAAATSAAGYYTKGEDPTEELNYPPCAQSCVNAHAFAGCGGYANRVCVCQSPTYASVVGSCYRSFCSADDVQVIVDLSDALCEPVGGTGNFSTSSNSSVLPFTGGAPSSLGRVGFWIPLCMIGGVVVVFWML